MQNQNFKQSFMETNAQANNTTHIHVAKTDIISVDR